MKYRTKSLLAVALVILLSVATLAPTTSAQQRRRFRADTGVVTLGMGQVLRITISSEGFEDGMIMQPRFGWVKYGPMTCNTEGVCRQTVQSQGTTTPISINQHESASFDLAGPGSVRVQVFSLENVAGIINAANCLIINTSTGETVSHVIMANTEGD